MIKEPARTETVAQPQLAKTPSLEVQSDWLKALVMQPGAPLPEPRPNPYGAEWTDSLQGLQLTYPKTIADLDWTIYQWVNKGTVTKVEFFRDMVVGTDTDTLDHGANRTAADNACNVDQLDTIRDRLKMDFGPEQAPPKVTLKNLDNTLPGGTECYVKGSEGCTQHKWQHIIRVNYDFKPGWKLALHAVEEANNVYWTTTEANHSKENYECGLGLVLTKDDDLQK
ncbi:MULTISPECIES: hypothetical protein [Rhodanobacter]|uniref:hypothetical protein n=1 Tax=Rhodanobacter TaxID=75309 RepID=UPI000AA0C58E|nr:MULTISPECIES: hypothetical protein [Rhodanobacter]UJJ49833.1 hypothetical protein LRK52_11380 [Rhodanobacter denitrificans]UJM92546.1 hypothetical protein LRK32_11290 [Rhodanobacter denitrificans]UJM96076.1 hypothetical protein LRK44_11295 [Rhodanobacter denitrificans]UJN21093.1 hypothetical protein LRK54_15345 [Rhodanobacter denitrificans]